MGLFKYPKPIETAKLVTIYHISTIFVNFYAVQMHFSSTSVPTSIRAVKFQIFNVAQARFWGICIIFAKIYIRHITIHEKSTFTWLGSP